MTTPPFVHRSNSALFADFPEPLTAPEAISTRDAMEELQRRYSELADLFAAGAQLSATLDWNQLTALIINAAIQLGKAAGGSLLLENEYNPGELYIAAARDLPPSVITQTRLRVGDGLAGWVAAHGESRLVLGALDTTTYPNAFPKPAQIGSSICVPLRATDSSPILGVLCIHRHVGMPGLSHSELRVIEALGHQASVALQNARLYHRLQRRAVQLENLVEISARLIATLDVDIVLRSIIDKAVELLQCEAGSLLLSDTETGGMVFKVAVGPAGQQLVGTKLPPGAGIVGAVMREGKPLIVNDAKADPRHYTEVDASTQHITQNLLCVPLKNKTAVLGVIEVINKLDGTPFTEDDSELLMSFAWQGTLTLENARLYSELRRSFNDVVRIIANAVEARDPYTAGHTSRVTDLALETAREMGWSREQLETLEGGALLHDIGKIGIRDWILRKPGGLTDDEYAEMKQHPIVGAQMLEGVAALRPMLPYILYHQERYDGKGYPFGLVGKEIPIEGRLLAVVDTFDAMTSDRPYRKGLSIETALAEIIRNRGTQFDPDVVDALLRVYKKGKLNSSQMDKNCE